MSEKHIFALYSSEIKKANSGEPFPLYEDALIYRIQSVLRIKPGEEFILFNEACIYQGYVISIRKKSIEFQQTKEIHPTPLTPKITLILPLLKKDNLEQAVYNTTELGVTTISLIVTEKSRKELTQKEFDRLNLIRIAAAEQAKNFSLPLILAPAHFSTAIESYNKKNTQLYTADHDGSSFISVLKDSETKNDNDIVYCLGPEAGFTQEEKKLLEKNSYSSVKLTNTTLRALQAATLGVGIIRSL